MNLGLALRSGRGLSKAFDLLDKRFSWCWHYDPPIVGLGTGVAVGRVSRMVGKKTS